MSGPDDWDGDAPDDRLSRKRDRLARLLKVASILYASGSGESGVPSTEIARLTGMTTRTVYRDIRALEDELAMPIFQAGKGRYGKALLVGVAGAATITTIADLLVRLDDGHATPPDVRFARR